MFLCTATGGFFSIPVQKNNQMSCCCADWLIYSESTDEASEDGKQTPASLSYTEQQILCMTLQHVNRKSARALFGPSKVPAQVHQSALLLDQSDVSPITQKGFLGPEENGQGSCLNPGWLRTHTNTNTGWECVFALKKLEVVHTNTSTCFSSVAE